MEEEEEEEEEPPTLPPFWLQPTTTSHQRLWPHLPSSAFFLSTGFLVPILCISSIVFLVLVIPSLISLTHQVFKPSSVRKSWDSLNLVLILFAIVCGFLGRKADKDDDPRDQDVDNTFNVIVPQSPLIPHQQYNSWYGYEFGEQGCVTKLMRTSSSYPDLRQELSWDAEYDHKPRFYDDSYAINDSRPPRSLRSIGSFRYQKGIDLDYVGEVSSYDKRIEIDTVTMLKEKESTPLYYSKARKSTRKEFENVGRRGRKAKVPPSPPPPPPTPAPPPPPPQPPLLGHHEHDKTRKKSGKSVTKEILTSIYQQSKRKNKLLKRKNHEINLKNLWQPSPPRPPPTPPPPPSKIHNIFSPKKPKSSKRTTSSSTTHPIASTSTKFDPTYETTIGGYESPTIPIPPPPPPPPFKLPPWKFSVHGDYVKINSSPKGGGHDESEFEDGPVAGNATPAEFCPSPDVNSKADDFIARFKATLKLEKINSIKMKEGVGIGLSPLGPDSSPSPSPHAMAISGLF